MTSLNLPIRSTGNSNTALFASSLNWNRRHVGVSISTGSKVSIPYTMVNEVSLLVECGMVWYDHNISWSNSTHKPLESSSFFLSSLRITLFVDFACPLARGCTTDKNFVCTPKSLQKYHNTRELGPIVRDDGSGKSIPTHSFLPIETVKSLSCGFNDNFRLYQFGEIINSHYQEFQLVRHQREYNQDVHASLLKRQGKVID